MKARKVAMSLMAHPDDGEFLAAGTLALLAERGWEIHTVTMTPGEAGSATKSPDAIAAIRRREGAKAAAVIGGRYHCLESRDVYVTYGEAVVRRAILLTREINPTLVFTHSLACYTVDHEETARIARAASFGFMIRNIPEGPVPRGAQVPHLYYADPIEGLDPYGQIVRATQRPLNKILTLCASMHNVGRMNYHQANVRAEILKALAHPVRVLIVHALSDGEQCVCELNKLADIDQSGLSRHLASLKRAGIVSDRREGMKVFYRLETPCILKAFECAVDVVRADAKRRSRRLNGVGQ